ncbi:MAG: MATE family efflux transporter, partial [Oscillospiraceae bacterium]|nr:MATE family efflux transporter [Oscillospiraceae bacterium]
MQSENSLLMFERESILKLMLKFALPAIASMVVNSIYNIVDQIFIGQGVGMLGNAATNLTFPLVTLSMALSTMIADGCVAYFSIKLGQKRYDEATRTMGNGITVALAAGLFLLVFIEIFLRPVLLLCGGSKVQPVTMAYAMDYARITLLGLPFVTISMTVSSIIRAQGNPRYAMICMMSGCFLNIILDAWFIMGLGWGVKGAAWATVIGQALNFFLCIRYIPKFKSIHFEFKYAKLKKETVMAFLPLGVSSLCTQLANTVVVICMNNLLTKYGTQSVYGADIPLASLGIVMKVNSIIISVMVGLGVGSQPIVGYNYGAKNFKRVKSTYLRTIIVGLIIGV